MLAKLMALTMLVALGNCADLIPAQAAPEPAATVRLTESFTFAPPMVTIHAGESIEWRNESPFAHTVTDDPAKAGQKEDAALPAGAAPFSSGELKPGATYRMRFATPGTYHYFCMPHEGIGMLGEIMVLPAR